MFTEQFFQLLLDLGDDWSVREVETNRDIDEIDIYLEYVGDLTRLGRQVSLYDHAPERRWRHLNTMQYKTYINCRVPRVKTAEGKVETLPVPWAGSYDRHTHLFESAVISLLSVSKNQSETARFLDCSFDLVNRIMAVAMQRGMARREDEADKVVYENVSIDEKAIGSGHN